MFGNKDADILERLERLEQQLSRVEGKLDQLLGASHGASPSLDDVLRGLVDSRQKIQAIKFYRQVMGVGLKEAKEYVDRLEAGVAPGAGVHVASPAHDPQMDEVRRLAQSGQKIPAIKRYRELTGLGLKDAKEAVEAMIEPSSSAW